MEFALDAAISRASTPVQTWARALGNIAGLRRNDGLTLARLLDDLADRYDSRPAVQSADTCLSYRQIAQLKNQYARWAKAQGVRPSETVCLFMLNSPDYLAIWLGITQIGAVAALINTNLTGGALLHAIQAAGPCHIIADITCAAALQDIAGDLPPKAVCWTVGGAETSERGGRDLDCTPYACVALTDVECGPVRGGQTALLIYTSGTTGLPKAARVSHYRVLEWSFWFAGMMNTGPDDKLLNCLPMYHSTGGVAGIGAVLVNGGTVILRERFSATRFWDDIAGSGATLFLYIGELCRYLVGAPPHHLETRHRLRLCCGNGLREDVWPEFATRFGIPKILEFYASTEGNVALYNVEGRPGAIGRVPSFLAHRFPVSIVQCDPVTGEPARGADGFCIKCAADEVGEAIGKILGTDDAQHRQFEGYTDDAASERKILRNAFTDGDSWFRTGDLMRRDASGFFYFVDRLGDTFRWKGENVSTTQVEDVINRCPGVTGAVVYGVAVPGAEGRAGMAAISVNAEFSLPELHATLTARLPRYARPLFLRVCDKLETTGTFKPVKAALAREGFDAAALNDPIYTNDPVQNAFVRLAKTAAG
jgi:fatty-acyl-CoA synthase